MLRIVGMTDADVAVGVDHLFFGEDAVGDHEVLDDGVDIAHVSMTRIDVLLIKWGGKAAASASRRSARTDHPPKPAPRSTTDRPDRSRRLPGRSIGLEAVGPRVAVEDFVDLVDVTHQERRHVAERAQVEHLLERDLLRPENA